MYFNSLIQERNSRNKIIRSKIGTAVPEVLPPMPSVTRVAAAATIGYNAVIRYVVNVFHAAHAFDCHISMLVAILICLFAIYVLWGTVTW